MDSDAQAAESSPRGNSRYGIECATPDRAVAGDTFDAMGMQRVPVREAFYEARFLGNRRQMPTMQTYRVYSDSLRRPDLNECHHQGAQRPLIRA